MSSQFRKNSFSIFLMVIIVIMGFEIVYLIYQNRKLQDMLATASSVQVLQQGQVVPPLITHDINGNEVNVNYGDDQPATLLVWFSPSCHVCSENSAFWNDMYTRCKTGPIRFLALSDADIPEIKVYVSEHSLLFPVISMTVGHLIDAYNGRVMPQTALISPQGGIVKVWPGALEKSRQDEIINTLDSLID